MKKRIISAFLLMFVAIVALIPSVSFKAEAASTETSATISFASTAQRTSYSTSQQVWENGGVTFTNNKASSTSNVGNYSNPVRIYASSSIIFTAPGNITKIVVTASNASYATVLKNSVGNEATVSGSTVTITPSSSNTSYTVAKVTAQTRFTSLTIYYEEASACTHTNTNTTTTDTATCTADGIKTVTCECGEIISTEASSAKEHTPGTEADCENAQTCTVCGNVVTEALGHNYIDGSCTVCGQADPDACAHANTTTTDSATCTADGTKTTKCKDCDVEISSVASPAKGHTPGTEADCENAQTCTVCDVVVTEALGHNHVDGVCTECGDKLPVAFFVVPEGATAPGNAFGPSFTAPEAPELPDANYDYDYTFAGWATSAQGGVTAKPELYAPGSTVAIDADTTFYAVYSYVEIGKTTVSGYIKTDLSDIQSTDVVVITMAKGGVIYALTSANGSSSAPTAVKVTANGDQLTGDIANALLWNISNSGGNLTIYVNGSTTTWLYCTNANNGVRVGTNAAKVFTIDSSSGYLKHTGTGRYVGVYTSNPDWRCYDNTTGNTANQTLAFYVYTNKEVTTEVSYYTTTLATSECEHNYVPEITEDATCTADGIMTYTCSECGNAYTETIEATGHSYTEYTSNGDATCTADGTKTATCDNGCGSESTVKDEGSATGHNYEDNYCTVCGHFDINSVDISGRYYIATKRTEGNYWFLTGVLTDSSTTRYVAFNSGLTELPASIAGGDADKIFVIVKNNDGTYSIYAEGIDGDNNYLGWTSGNSGTLVAASDALKFTLDVNQDGTFSFHFNGDEERYLSLNNTAGSDYFAFYKGTQKQNLSLIPVVEEVTPEPQAPEFSGASLNIGQDLSIRYHVIPGDETVLGDYTVRFTMNGKEVIVSGVEEGGKFVFSFTGIAPQCMSDIVKAELLLNGEVVDTIEEYSVANYAADALELHATNTELCTLIVDLLYYGAAAQSYRGYNVENLATSVLTDEQKAYASAFDPADAANNRGVNVIDNTNATFTAAGVNFDYNNRIYVKFTTADVDNVTVTVGGVELEIISLGGNKYVAYSDRISALDFDEVVTFTLNYGSVEAATLTYTINDYSRAMSDDADIGELALALYRYGMSAEKYELSK